MPKAKEYVFNLLEDGITQTTIKKYLECKRLFYFSLMRGYSPARDDESMIWGILFHRCLELYYSHLDSPVSVEDIPDHVLEEYEGNNDSETWSLEVRQEWEILKAKLFAVFPAYLEWYSQEDAAFKWHALEPVFKFGVPVSLRNGKKVEVPVTGKIDGLVDVPKPKRRLAIFETKTKGRINLGGLTNTLLYDLQLNLYGLAANKLQPGGNGPYTSAIYNIVHNPSLRFTGVKEDIDGYCDRIKKDIAKNPADYFMRLDSPLSAKNLAEFEKHLTEMCTEIANFVLVDGGKSTDRYTPNCLGPWGQCDLLEVCYHGTTSTLKQREFPHPELED